MKSQPEFYLGLFFKVLEDCSSCVCENHARRDKAYAESRFRHEGISFFTTVLPTFGKAIVRGLEDGVYTPVNGLARRRGGLLPKFLQGWTSRIFMSDGTVGPTVDPFALQEVLQLCSLFYKLELPYSQEKVDRVITSFVETEDEIPKTSEEVLGTNSVLDLAGSLLRGVLRGFDPRKIKPGHGPGAVASGERGNLKYGFAKRFQRLHQKFPYYEFFAPSLSGQSFESGWYSRLEPSVLPIAKVCLVPKDSRGPRLISMEPLEIQWIQQGLLRALVPHIEASPVSGGEVNFTKQSFNQDAALSASVDGQFATLDLKDASDRVSLALVKRLFPEDFVSYLEACRSVATKLPDGRLIPLSKFAPMGSALCFPVMALTIWSLTKATLLLKHRSRRRVLVYGDDLIVPTPYVDDVVQTLHAVGLRVNLDKSFKDSLFRESCGMDAYSGVQVTPARFRKPIEFDRGHPSPALVAHLCSFSESLFDRGFWKACQFVRDYTNGISGQRPWTPTRCSVDKFEELSSASNRLNAVSFYSPSREECVRRNRKFRQRWNPDLQRVEWLLPTVTAKKTGSPVGPQVRSLKGLLGLYRWEEESGWVTLRGQCAIRWRWNAI